MSAPVLPIRRIVFYRHGVAYLEREGHAEGNITLDVREGDMSDVLKSLAVSATVRSVGFETPEDPSELATRRGMTGLFESPLRALLARLRGSRVVLDTASGSRITGVLVGCEVRSGEDGAESERVVLQSDRRLAIIDVADVRAITGEDAELEAELGALLEHVRGQDRGEARKLVLEVAEPGVVRCGYVVPAAPWRVAYRLTLDEDATSGMLSAHALLHNPTDESIDAAQAVLTTGEPQSFSLELHRPTQVRRAVIQETERGGRPPAMYDRDVANKRMSMRPQRAMAMSASRGADDEAMSVGGFGAAESHPEPNTRERGELFEYALAEPLTLKRGRSAMVPLVSRSVQIAKERVYRADRGSHPDLVVGFLNDTGVVLEEGAAVLYEIGDYAGEAMLPLTGKGSRVRLAYGSDQALVCHTDFVHKEVMVGLSLVQNDFVEQRRRERHVTLTIASERDDDVDVLFELPKQAGHVPMPGSIEPKEETLEARRYVCRVAARSTASILLQEAAVFAVRIDADAVTPRILEWARTSPLEGTHGVWQAKLLALVHVRASLAKRLADAQAQRQALSHKRQELASELASMGHHTPEEMRVRTKLASALEELYERARVHDASIDEIEIELAAATTAMADHVRG